MFYYKDNYLKFQILKVLVIFKMIDRKVYLKLIIDMIIIFKRMIINIKI